MPLRTFRSKTTTCSEADVLAVGRADNSLPLEIGVNQQTSGAAGPQLSPDGLWYRDEGSSWSTLSPDRVWRWNGQQWIPDVRAAQVSPQKLVDFGFAELAMQKLAFGAKDLVASSIQADEQVIGRFSGDDHQGIAIDAIAGSGADIWRSRAPARPSAGARIPPASLATARRPIVASRSTSRPQPIGEVAQVRDPERVQRGSLRR
jgi:hypothetical protein